jgi:hypothetical protein
MDLSRLFPPVQDDGSSETCTIGTHRCDLSDVAFAQLPNATLPDATWVDGGSATLFSTPSRTIALVKIAQVHTSGLARTGQDIHIYLVSVTADTDTFLVRAQTLSNPHDAITAAFTRDIPHTTLPDDSTPERVVDIVRTIAEHTIAMPASSAADAAVSSVRFGAAASTALVIHDGSVRTQNGYLATQLRPQPCIAKTTGVLTSKGRPLGLALLMRAPAGTWHARIADDIALARLHDRASHVFLVEQPTPALLSLLRAWSADAAFPGYPYPLVLADQLARVTNNERDALRIVVASDETAMGIISGELPSSDAHDVLEHILYGK